MFFLWAMLALNHKYENRFFYNEEPYFGAVAIFLTGWPGWLYYLIILLTLFLIFNFFGTLLIKNKKSELKEKDTSEGNVANVSGAAINENGVNKEARFSLYYFWLPVAVVIIIIMFYAQQNLPYFNVLKI